MFSLSHSVGYAIRALAYLDTSEGNTSFVRDIAQEADLPKAYLAKLFKKLANAGILESKRGQTGGTRLARPSSEISILDISEAIVEQDWVNTCLLGLDDCSEQRYCPTHIFWKDTREKIKDELSRTTLADVIAFEQNKNKRENHQS